MSEEKQVKQPTVGKTGLWLAIIGALLIIIDGAIVLATGNFYGWHYGSATLVGWTEVILSIIIFIVLYWYNKSPQAVGWTVAILAIITLPFDGGFYTCGAWIGLIGGILIAYRK
ncbi:MAG: hypothetical protein GSR79_09520 [Desulfurococcales archaeon]|nr:hypothetical protein [Desulfurococcales archaeon]